MTEVKFKLNHGEREILAMYNDAIDRLMQACINKEYFDNEIELYLNKLTEQLQGAADFVEWLKERNLKDVSTAE